jgi:methionyl-tRNA formyltransferase
MDAGVDTGNIIHQERAEIFPFDNPHQIGNRLIKQMTRSFIKLIVNFHLVEKKYPTTSITGKTYKIKDATDELTSKLYNNFRNNAVVDFLKNKEILTKQFPLVKQSFL